MKLECIKEKLAAAVARAERITGKNLSLPILSCIHLEAANGTLTVRATNLSIGIELTIPVKVIEEGIVAVPGSTLSSFLSALQNEKSVFLETKGQTLTVSTPTNTTTINTVSYEDFPTIPVVAKHNRFFIPVKDLLSGFKAVAFSASVSTVKPEYSSILLYTETETLVFAATDSFRLAEKRVRYKKGGVIQNILIPFKNTNEVIKILGETPGDVAVDIDGSQIAFSVDGVYITSRLIDGTFPDYKQIFPKEHLTEVVVLKQDFLNAMKIANIFSDAFMQVNLKVEPKQKLFEVRTKNAAVGEQVSKIPAAFSGEEVTMNFNYRYLLDSFPSIEADSVSFLLNGPSRPLVVRGVSDKSFTYLVMPMNR